MGTLVLTRLADAIGRRPVFLGCVWAGVVFRFIRSFSTNFVMYLVFGVLSGVAEQVYNIFLFLLDLLSIKPFDLSIITIVIFVN